MNKLTHSEIRKACRAGQNDAEMICPCCGHGHLQLFGKDAFDCKNGCDNATVAAEIRKRLGTGETSHPGAAAKPKKLKPSELPDWKGFTLDEYCSLKKLNRRILEYLYGVQQVIRGGKPVVAWPYPDENGKLLATKIRKSSNSHDTFFEPADPHVPFGLNNPHLKNMIARSYDLILAEGETDCLTFGSWGMAVLGISGAEGWLPEYADYPVVDNAGRVLVATHNDDGGKRFAAKILRDLPKAIILRPPTEVNDWNDLHLKYADFEEEAEFTQHPFLQHSDIAIQAGTLERAMRQPKAAKPKPAPMRDEAFQGLAGRIVKLLEPAMEADRVSILSNVLGCTAVLFKHEAHFKVAADIHYPDNYFLTVGNSAISRKGMTTNAVLHIMEEVQAGFKDRIIRGLSTGQGLILALIKKRPEDEEDECDLPSEPKAPAVLIEISEFAELLAVMKREENTLSAVMRDAWDGKPLEVTTRHEPLKVRNVSLATLAHITRRELLDKLTSTERANGFANRFLFLWTERTKLVPHPKLDMDFSGVAIALLAAVDTARGVGAIERDEEANLLWAEAYKELTLRGDTMTDALLARADAHVARLSLLYALLDSSRVIRKEHLKAALAVWDYCQESVQFIFGEAADPEFGKILRKLEDGPLTTGEIRRRVFGDHKPSEWIAEKMAALEELRKVRRGTKELKTKEADAWFLVEF